MQHFLLFFTMLIISSDAFSRELHGRHIPTSVRRKTFRLAPRLKYFHPIMFSDSNFPKFREPLAFESRNYEAPFFVPFHHPDFRLNHVMNCALQKNRRFCRRKRQKKKRTLVLPLHVRGSFFFNTPQCFQSEENFVNYFGDSQRDVTRYPNQYIVCLYPVFNNFRKRTFRRAPSFERQYLINLKNQRIKNKRSTNDTSDETDSTNKQEGATIENDIENPKIYKPSLYSHDDDIMAEDNVGSYNLKENLATHKLPFDFGLEPDESTVRNPFLPSTNSFNDYTPLDVTLPPITIPKFTFKYPYDPQVYESSLRKDRLLPDKPLNKETTNIAEETAAFESFPRDLGKLKVMLEEVESVLKSKVVGKNDEDESGDKKKKSEKQKKKKAKKKEKEEKDESDKGKKEKEEKDESGKGKKELEGPEKQEVAEKINETITIKEKIDTMAIPILSQISKELGKVANETLSLTSPNSSLPSSSSKSSSTAPPLSLSSSTSLPPSSASESKSKKSKMRCRTDGTWTSTGLGFDMTFTTMPNMMLKVKVSPKGDSLINKKWSIHGLTLSKRGGPLMLAAIYPQKRKIASFIGQCKMCKDKELIFGAWTIYTCTRRFTDLWKAVETKLDILKKVKE